MRPARPQPAPAEPALAEPGLTVPDVTPADPLRARLPPPLPGLDPAWSRLVPVTGADSRTNTTSPTDTWHILDSHAPAAGTPVPRLGTIVCVHGNPTWSYLWRRLVATPPPGWRVIAVDQLGMGYSERPGRVRRLGDRIDDLGRLTSALGITGRVVVVAHDWGGPVALGWALAHRDQIAGIVLANTAVHQPAGSPAPALIRLARAPGLRQLICQRTPAFVATTAALSRPPLPRAVRAALAAPYKHPDRRRAIADFVADIPLDDAHPSAPALASVVAGLPTLAGVPVLLLWGPRDPVFSDRYLRDLLARFPQADVHRFEGASHLVTEDRPETAAAIARWITLTLCADFTDAATAEAAAGTPTPDRPLWAALERRRHDDHLAVAGPGGDTTTFAELARQVDDAVVRLRRAGVGRGDRVALLVPPGIELTVVVYACWRLGAVIVVADAGLGLRRLGRALRGSGGQWVIGSRRGLLAAWALRVPGRRLPARPAPPADAETEMPGAEPGAEPGADELCAVVFTSGATGPPKGVVYRHGQVQQQLSLLTNTYAITPADRLVAAFAPFALYGPALGIASAVPDMDVTAPATLTAAALADAVLAIDATVVFASPAALTNVVATAGALGERQRAALRRPRLVLSAGAPLPVALLEQVRRLLPGAAVHTPYGMTEALPVTDVTLDQIRAAGDGDGVCVGRPVAGVTVAISPLDADGSADAPPRDVRDVTGEVCVRAGHAKLRYDRLWVTDAAATRDPRWHRTGDVGHLDREGRLWIEGRLGDVARTAAGPVTPVPVEQRIQRLGSVAAAAVVAVGPPGCQQLVTVLVEAGPTAPRSGRRRSRLRLAGLDLADEVRGAAEVPLAAVLLTDRLPVDIRHNSKIDHPRLARRAAALLAGHTARRDAGR